MKRIYVSHPYSGLKENEVDVANIITELSEKYPYPKFLFYSPIHTFSFLYNKVSYDCGIAMCYDLLDYCDELWAYGESKGVLLEIAYAKKHHKKVRIMDK